MLKTVELFAGIGGFRLAADAAGLDTVWANDMNPEACKVYRDNFGGGVLTEGDISKLVAETPPHEILTAGFPCQPFSMAGKKRALDDERGGMFWHVLQVIWKHWPEWVVLENVPSLLTTRGGEGMRFVLKKLFNSGYGVQWRVLEASRFGLAQKRHRLFIVASRQPTLPLPLETVEDQTWDIAVNMPLPAKLATFGICFPTKRGGIIYGTPSSGKELPQVHPRRVLDDVLDREYPPDYDMTESTLARLERGRSVDKVIQGVHILANLDKGKTAGYTVYATDGLCPTLTCNSSRHYERYFHNGRYRRLTPWEYARLQGFPDDHCKCLSNRQKYRVLGNAVPPPVAAWVLGRVRDAAERLREQPVPDVCMVSSRYDAQVDVPPVPTAWF